MPPTPLSLEADRGRRGSLPSWSFGERGRALGGVSDGSERQAGRWRDQRTGLAKEADERVAFRSDCFDSAPCLAPRVLGLLMWDYQSWISTGVLWIQTQGPRVSGVMITRWLWSPCLSTWVSPGAGSSEVLW